MTTMPMSVSRDSYERAWAEDRTRASYEGWLEAEAERLRASLLTVVEQVESCCSRFGLCIDADRIRAEAQRPMDGS